MCVVSRGGVISFKAMKAEEFILAFFKHPPFFFSVLGFQFKISATMKTEDSLSNTVDKKWGGVLFDV